jgi:hypothetical protein
LVEVKLFESAALHLRLDEFLMHDKPNRDCVIVDGNVPAPASII